MTDSQTREAGQLFDELQNDHQDIDSPVNLQSTAAIDDKTCTDEFINQNSFKSTLSNGTLPPEAKKALVYLYRYGSILMDQNRERYEILCKHEDSVRQHMADVYMEVIYDHNAGHIFTQIASPDDDEEEPARLITAKPLSIYQSIVAVVLRKYFQERETAGEQKIIIDFERLSSLLVPYLKISHSDRKDQDKLNKSISSMVDKRLLIKIRGEQDRFQISPIIRNVVNAQFLESLLNEYQKLLDDEPHHVEENSNV